MNGQNQQTTKYEIKKQKQVASKVFIRCPHCNSSNIFALDEEVFCQSCNWNSIEASVCAGLCDDLLNLDLDALGAQENQTGVQSTSESPSSENLESDAA